MNESLPRGAMWIIPGVLWTKSVKLYAQSVDVLENPEVNEKHMGRSHQDSCNRSKHVGKSWQRKRVLETV